MSALIGDIGRHCARFGVAGDDDPHLQLHSFAIAPNDDLEKLRHGSNSHLNIFKDCRFVRYGGSFSEEADAFVAAMESARRFQSTESDGMPSGIESQPRFVPVLRDDAATDGFSEPALEAMWNEAYKHHGQREHIGETQSYAFDRPVLVVEPIFQSHTTPSTTPSGPDGSAVGLSSALFRSRSAELHFETFGCSSLALVKSPVLAAFALGRTTAVVVDMSHHGTKITAVVDGWAESRGRVEMSVGGHVCDRHLLNVLTNAAASAGDPSLLTGGEGPSLPLGRSPSHTPSFKSRDPFAGPRVDSLAAELLRQSVHFNCNDDDDKRDLPVLACPAIGGSHERTREWCQLMAVRHFRQGLTTAAAVASKGAEGEDGEHEAEAEVEEGQKKRAKHESASWDSAYTLPDGTILHLRDPYSSAPSSSSSSSSSSSPSPSSLLALTDLVASLYLNPGPLVSAGLVKAPPPDHKGTGTIMGVGGEFGSGSAQQQPLSCPLPRLVNHCSAHFLKDLQTQLYRSVVLCGGHSRLLADTHLPDKLKAALAVSAPPRPASMTSSSSSSHTHQRGGGGGGGGGCGAFGHQYSSASNWEPVQVYSAPPRYRGHEAWLGGSIVASLAESMREISISRQEYQEHGARVLDKKCP